MVLQHNLEAMNAHRSLNTTAKKQSKSAEKLSSGYKINRAADDAAGLTISEGMRAMVRGLGRASDNTQDGLSLLQTADGALNEVHSILHRAKELSVQAANDTNTELDRAAIQGEVDELLKEINRIADTTEFNTLKLLDGSIAGEGDSASPLVSPNAAAGSARLQEGMRDVNNTIIRNPLTQASASAVCTPGQITSVENVVGSAVPKAVGAVINSLSVFNSNEVSDSIGVSLYADGSSTLAYVECRYSYDGSGRILGLQLNLSVNVQSLDFDPANPNNLTNDSRRALEATIAHEMMHAFMDDVFTNGMLGATQGIRDKSNAFPGWFKEGMAQVAAGGCSNDNDWVNGGLGLAPGASAGTVSSVVQSSGNKLSSGTTASKYGTGYLACMYLGYLASGNTTVDATNLRTGMNNLLQKIKDGTSLSAAIKEFSGGRYRGLSDFQNKFGDADSAQFVSQLLAAVGGTGNGSLINGDLTNSDILTSAPTNNSKYVPDFSSYYTVSPGPHLLNDGGSGGYRDGGPALNLQVGSLGKQGVAIAIYDTHTMALGIDEISVMSFEDASEAIYSFDYALQIVSENRSSIGAYMNRLEHTIANVDNTEENTQAAESRIRDTDMAEEMVTYSTQNILAQAGQSMLAQANQGKQGILQLLQ